MEQKISADTLTSFPAVDEAAVDSLLQAEIAKDDTKFIVLDDDPTGVQTVHDISVYTDWSVESIKSGLMEPQKVFYILTNSRGLTVDQTTAVHREIAANIVTAARETGKAAPQPQEGAGEKKEEGERKAPRRRRRHRSKGGGGKPAAPQGED